MGRTMGLFEFTLLAAFTAAVTSAVGADVPSDCAGGKPVEARIRACSSLIDAKPTPSDRRAEAYRIRAAAYSEKANHKQAIADFTEAINLKGDAAAAYFGRSQSRLAESDAAGAVSDLTQAMRYSEPAPRLFTARGYAQLVKGDAARRWPTSRLRCASIQERRHLQHARPRLPQDGRSGQGHRRLHRRHSTQPRICAGLQQPRLRYEARGDKPAAAADFRRALSLDPALVGAKMA